MKHARKKNTHTRTHVRGRQSNIGSLCTGYGGLDMAVMAVFGGHLAWCADNDKHVTAILATRLPDVPNLGDLTKLNWNEVEPVDILCAGFPCQDISSAGRGAGIEKGVRSGIWKNITQGIRILRPKFIVVENVAAIRHRGLDRVLGDLAQVGYSAVWTSLRASDVGAAHRRERVFILGYDKRTSILLTVAHALCQREPGGATGRQAASAGTSGTTIRSDSLALLRTGGAAGACDFAWRRYEPAIRSWEALTGRPAPHPIEFGTRGRPRLSPIFSEWLMGLPKGFVTDLALPYSAKHRAIGNGVVPQQAVRALWQLVAMAVGAYPEEQALT